MAIAFASLAAVQARNNWAGLLKINNAKGLIIQLDTDIAYDIKVNNVAGQPGDRSHCHNAISQWLGLTQVPDTVHYLLPSFSTESWILALHDESHLMFNDTPKPVDFESIQDPCDILIKGGYKSYHHKEKRKTCLSKDYDLYTYYGKLIGDNYNLVANRCSEFHSFYQYI